jgi:hypothetical protein
MGRPKQISVRTNFDETGRAQQRSSRFPRQLTVGLLVSARQEIVFMHDFHRHDCTH